jgi:phenylacetate-CoA ligase
MRFPTPLPVLSHRVFAQAVRRGALFRVTTTREQIEAFQCARFNELWRDTWLNVPFYAEWKRSHGLPDEVGSLREVNAWPILEKKHLQAGAEGLVRPGRRPDKHIKTGGSTGEPLCLPAWNDDGTVSSSQWLGRIPYGFWPGMPTFLLWGHEHLYGKGLRRRQAAAVRRLKDTLSSMRRVSAYDLSVPAMSEAFEAYRTQRPGCVIGFSAAVVAFCRVNAALGRRIPSPTRLVVCTAGPLSAAEKQEVEAYFESTVCMEYGSAEAAVMAYTVPGSTDYRVFWDTHLLQVKPDDNGSLRNIVTCLTPAYAPLIRYDIGDYVTVDTPHESSQLVLTAIAGRPSEIVQLPNGAAFFGALIGDCVKQVPGIVGSQTIVRGPALDILVTASRQLTADDFALVRARLNDVVPELRHTDVTIRQVDRLRMTSGGKTPLVLREMS